MNILSKIIYNFGKLWLTIVLFIAMVVSTIVSLPFIAAAKILDLWRAYHVESGKNHLTDFYS